MAELNQEYIEKIKDILAYEKPYNPAALLVCPDEKTGPVTRRRQASDSGRTGQDFAKKDNEYKRSQPRMSSAP